MALRRRARIPYNGDAFPRRVNPSRPQSRSNPGEVHLINYPTRLVLAIPVVFLIALLCFVGIETAAAGPYVEGDFIEITGTVTDRNGTPIPDVHVVFGAAKKSFSISQFGNTTKDQVEQRTKTDRGGQFKFRWRWVEYYNRYEILVGIPRRSAAGASFEVLTQVDISKRIRKGSPVVVALKIEEGEFLDNLREFLTSVDTEDENRIYDEMGNPDRVQKIEHPDYDEISWWYFEAGETYRFRDGALQQKVHFDPIAPFDP